MYLPKLELRGWNEFTIEERKISLSALCEAMITHNMIWLRKNPGCPHLYDCLSQFGKPITYELKRRPGNLDAWSDIPQVIARGMGDCKDFSCWLVALYRLQRVSYGIYPVITDHQYDDPSGNGPPITLYHVRVGIGHDHIEDPSAVLGMPYSVSYGELAA